MPELPEVETIKRDLDQRVRNLTIEKVKVFDDRVIADRSTRSFMAKLKGKTFQSFSRRAKCVICHLSPKGYLIIQPKMTGHMLYGEIIQEAGLRVLFELSNGKYLNYRDIRLFGWLSYVEDLSEFKHFQTLGPEPFDKDFSVEYFTDQLKRRTMAIKPALMNPQIVVGVGNIYASEILYDIGLNPKTSAKKVTKKKIQEMHESIQKILKKAIDMRGSSMRDYRDAEGQKGGFMKLIQVYGRAGEKCYRCSAEIVRIVQAQRSTFYCKKCQR